MTMTEHGRSPSGPGLRPFGAEPAAQSQAEPLVPNAGPRRISAAEFHAELAAQGVSHRDYAFKCVMCGNIQSMNSLVLVGVPQDKVDRYVAFSCEGRWNKERGCDWTLGGLFTIHKLEVVPDDGEAHPRFEIATPTEAQALASAIEARRAATAQTGAVHESAVAASETPKGDHP